jgi:hypothetical protein
MAVAGFDETTTTVDTYKVGTLVVDLDDSNNKQLIFRASANDTLSSNPEITRTSWKKRWTRCSRSSRRRAIADTGSHRNVDVLSAK